MPCLRIGIVVYQYKRRWEIDYTGNTIQVLDVTIA